MLYKKKWPLVVFLVPGLLFMLVFLYIPFVQNIKNSFYDMTAIIEMPGTEWKFIGFENYKKLFTDPDVRTALINSLKMMVLTVIFDRCEKSSGNGKTGAWSCPCRRLSVYVF